jgi:lipopolysaccharide export LptBFGC system permease protein LptF
MAGSKMRNSRLLSGATIMEVVVAMVIIVVVFGMAMMIFANITGQGIPDKKIHAQAILQDILLQAEQSRQFPEEPFNQDGFRIIPATREVENEPGLTELRLTAFDENQQEIGTAAEIMINKNETKP